MNNSKSRRQIPKLQLFLSEIPSRKKISNEDFNLCKAETSFDEFIESIFSNK